MLDIIIIIAAAVHLGDKAEKKGHRGQTGISAGIMLCGEIGGAILGYAIGGLIVLVICALLGLTFGVVIAHSRVTSLPDMSAHDMQAPTFGPSLGDQVIGAKCPRCHEPFLTLLEVEKCPDCGKAYHSKCLRAHHKKKHAKAFVAETA